MDNYCSNCGNALTGKFCSGCGRENSSSNTSAAITSANIAPQATGLSIASLIMAFFLPPAGLIMGILARNEIVNSNGEKGGEGQAIAAIVISIVCILLWIAIIAIIAFASSWNYY